MNTTQRRKLAMYGSVIAVCTDYKVSWEGLPAFVAVMESFESAISSIKENVEVQQLTTTGITRQKKLLKNAMVEEAIKIGGALGSYATAVNNNGLRDQVVFSPTELLRLPDGVCAEQCRVILTFAQENIEQTADYGLTQDVANAFEESITAYEAELGKTRRTIIQKKTATEKLKDLFEASDAMLSEHLDRLIEQLKDGNPEFYGEYHNARFIVDAGRKSLRASGEDVASEDVLPFDED